MGAPQHHNRFTQQQQQQPPPPPPPQGHWYSGEFQVMQPRPQQQMMWSPHSHHQSMASSAPPYPTILQHNPYPSRPHFQNHYRMLRPPPPPPAAAPAYSFPPQAYPQFNNHQAWGNSNWTHHQGWEHPGGNIPYNNGRDLAARSRAWPAANAAMENRHLQSQFTYNGIHDGHSNGYHDQYQQIVGPHYTDAQQPSLPASSHQQFQVPLANPHGPQVNCTRELFVSSGQSCYAPDVSYTSRDGALAVDSNGVLPHQGSVPMNSTVYQQEMPSSHSSIPAKAEVGDRNEFLRKPSPSPISAAQERQNHVQSTLLAHPSDRPLEFAPGFRCSNDPHTKASYVHTDPAGPVDPIAAVFPTRALTVVESGVVDPPISQVSTGQQFVPSFVVPSGPGHAVPINGQISGPTFQPNTMDSSSSVGLAAGTALHPTEPPFPGDANGGANVFEHLRMDNTAAAETTARNQEIQLFLTEILSKVTDELFDEIATKVLGEDYKTVKGVPTSNTSEKVHFLPENKETKANGAIEKSSSDYPQDLLSHASYASEDVGEEIQCSNKRTTIQMDADDSQLGNTKLLEEVPEAVEDGSSQAEIGGPSGGQTDVERDHDRTVPSDALHNPYDVDKGLSANGENNDFNCENDILPVSATLMGTSGILNDEINVSVGKMVVTTNCFELKDTIRGETYMNLELLHRDANNVKSMSDDPLGREARRKSDKNDELANTRRSDLKEDFAKEVDSGKIKECEKHSGSSEPRKQDKKYIKKEKTDDCNVLQEIGKDQITKPREKAKESNSRNKNSSKDGIRETDEVTKASTKDDGSRKRERVRDERGDRSRHRAVRNSSKHEWCRSSSVGSRGRNSKENSVGNRANESKDEVSRDSRQRKQHSRKHSLSPSPTRSIRRQVPWSSQRWHSSDFSHEPKRGRVSRSNSPVVHWQRKWRF